MAGLMRLITTVPVESVDMNVLGRTLLRSNSHPFREHKAFTVTLVNVITKKNEDMTVTVEYTFAPTTLPRGEYDFNTLPGIADATEGEL